MKKRAHPASRPPQRARRTGGRAENQRLNLSLFGAAQWISELESGSGVTAALFGKLATGREYDRSVLADLADAVPEPSTRILMLAGFAGLGFMARRAARRRAAAS